jgi:hypothetical protein
VTILGTHLNPGLRVGYCATTLPWAGGLPAWGRAFAIRRTLGAALPYWGMLVVFNLLFFVVAFAGFIRYDVRWDNCCQFGHCD